MQNIRNLSRKKSWSTTDIRVVGCYNEIAFGNSTVGVTGPKRFECMSNADVVDGGFKYKRLNEGSHSFLTEPNLARRWRSQIDNVGQQTETGRYRSKTLPEQSQKCGRDEVPLYSPRKTRKILSVESSV